MKSAKEWKKFRKKHIVHDLSSGPRSKQVLLLENNIVAKQYDKKKPSHVRRFHKEVMILKLLKDCTFVPKLFYVDDKKLILYMSYCGKSIMSSSSTLSKSQVRQVESYLQLLADKYGLFRMKNGKPTTQYKDIFPGNITLRDNNVYLIDFGSTCSWILKKK